jgi:RNA polymerase sigma-70 factor (sigma-E family)
MTALVIQYGRAMMDDSRSRRQAEVAELFDRHYRSLSRLAYVMLGDSQGAEDVVMEAFVKVSARWRRLGSVENMPAYLRRMVVNGCRGRIRRQKIERRVAGVLLGRAGTAQPEWGSERSDLQMDVWSAVRALPERQRACIVLRYLEDLADAEIAESLDCSVGTVKSQLSKARAKLQRTLSSIGSEVPTNE